MARKWLEVLSPKQINDEFNVYHGVWMPQMDRCWDSDDGFQVTSRLLMTEWGRVEHAVITRIDAASFLSSDGSADVSWAIKQEIKNELFGKDRVAIEVFPEESKLVDVCDCYHLWILPKGFKIPFGIHPTKDVQAKYINRGVNNSPQILENTKKHYDEKERLMSNAH